jgi:hypothetical protein
MTFAPSFVPRPRALVISRKTRLRRLPVGDNELPGAAESLGRGHRECRGFSCQKRGFSAMAGAGAAQGSTLRRDFGVGLH